VRLIKGYPYYPNLILYFGGIMKYLIPFIFVAFIHSTIINIPGDYFTIQEGIDNSVNGDTILVSAGTYFENINFNGKNISIIGENRETTMIDGEQNGTVVTFQSGENSSAVLSRFTITNGLASLFGGGIMCNNNSNPTLDKLTIANNSAEWGGGIYFGNSSPVLKNSKIINNSADWNAGGIYATGGFDVHLTDLIISENFAYNDGGGILAGSCAELNIVNTLISDNTAQLGSGGGITFGDISPILTNVTFTNNVAIDGGAILIYQDSAPILINSILWSNYPNEISFRSDHDPSEITISYCDIQGGEEGLTTYNNGIVFWENGNIDVDPQFVAPDNGLYTLQYSSPCIDTGNPDFDNDGISWENDPNDQDPDSTRMDMGAYYFNQDAGCTDDTAFNYNENAESDDGSCIYYGDVNQDGDIDVVDVIAMIGFVLDTLTPTPDQILIGDLFSDGEINILDVVSVIDIILLDDVLRDSNPIARATLIQNQNLLSLSKIGSVAGIQIEYDGDFSFESLLPEGWIMEKSEVKILIISLDGSELSGEDLFNYSGKLDIKSCMVVDWSLNKIQADIKTIPNHFSLNPAYPNPFNPTTTIEFTIPYSSNVVIKVFDINGNEVAELVNGIIPEGNHMVEWDARGLSSGLYFVKLTSGDYLGTRKLILLK
jgi:hypothetical protein